MGGSKVDIPQEYTIHVTPLQLSGGVELGLEGDLTIDAGLDDVNLALTGDPQKPVAIDLGLDDIRVKLDPVAIDLGLDNVNVCVSLALTEIPRVQIHLPTRYDFGFCLFGVPIFNFTFAGETMLTIQDNPPRVYHKPVTHEPPEPSEHRSVPVYTARLQDEEGSGSADPGTAGREPLE